MDKKEIKVGIYMRFGSESQLKSYEKNRKNAIVENELESNLALLQIYQLEDNFKNKLSR